MVNHMRRYDDEQNPDLYGCRVDCALYADNSEQDGGRRKPPDFAAFAEDSAEPIFILRYMESPGPIH
jgi:hypothetical protein